MASYEALPILHLASHVFITYICYLLPRKIRREVASSMRSRLRVFITACFYYGGLVKLAHWYIRRSGLHLIILNYHRATGDNLRRQLLYLRRHYRILHLETALEELYTLRNTRKQ